MMSKKILIDGRFIGVGDSISRYTLGVLSHLLEIDKENDYSLLIRPAGVKTVKENGLWDADNLHVHVFDVAHYSVEEQTKLLIWLNKRHFDLVYFTQFNHPILYRKPFIINIHDLTTFGYFHYENPFKVAMFRRVMKSAAFNSKKVISISNTTKDEILDHYPIHKRKVEVIYPGIDRNYLRISKMAAGDRYKLGKKFSESYELPGDYLLYTGMWKKHKNLLRLLEAFQKVESRKQEVENRRSIQLVLAGKIDRNQPEIVREIEQINGHIIDAVSNSDPVFVAGFVPEELLPSAYAGALAYVQPSLNEGFGLPPLEAMACGTPVIASNVSATPEILGDAAEYFEPESIEDIADKIDKIVNDSKLRINLQRKGFERIKLYTWEENAKKTLKVIQWELAVRNKK